MQVPWSSPCGGDSRCLFLDGDNATIGVDVETQKGLARTRAPGAWNLMGLSNFVVQCSGLFAMQFQVRLME